MAKIFRPDDQAALSRSQIDSSAVSRSAEGFRSLGSDIASVGRAFGNSSNALNLSKQAASVVDNQSKLYFKQTQEATQTALLAVKLAEATSEFLSEKDARMNSLMDEDGNPTYETLHSDIGNIGNKVLGTKLKKIKDPVVKQKLTEDFSSYVSNQQISSMNTARQQQLQYANTAVTSGLDSIVKQSLSDSYDNASNYESQGLKLIDDAAKSGIINPEDRDVMAKQFSETVRKSTVEKAIGENTQLASQMLSDPENLGLPEDQINNLNEQLNAKVKSDEIQLKKAEQLKERETKDKQGVLIETVKKKINTDTIREDELLSIKDELDPNAFNALKKEFLSMSEKRNKENGKLSEISNKLSTGVPVSDVSPSLLDKHFSNLTSSAEFELGRPLTMQEKAEISNTYKTKLRGFSKEVNSSVLSGDPKRAADAVTAYTYIRDTKSRTLEGNSFTNKAMAVAELAELYSERAGMSAEDSITKAREVVLNSTDQMRKDRKSEFRKNKSFNSSNLIETAADDLDAENFFGLNYDITYDSATTYKTLVDTFYQDTGDLDAAKKIAKAKMEETHGTSTFNGTETYMFAPPEKMFPEVVSLIGADGLREVFNNEMTIDFPDKDATKFRLVGDDLTRGNYINYRDQDGNNVRKEFVTYMVVEDKDVEGVAIETPLVDAEGRVQRWFPDTNKIANDLKQKSIDEARAERENAEAKANLERSAFEDIILK